MASHDISNKDKAAVLRVLTDAKAKIGTPDKWQKHAFATDKNGVAVRPEQPEACRWCALGALRAVSQADWRTRGLAEYALNQLIPSHIRTYGNVDFTNYNDSTATTHQDVMNAFDAAIEQLGGAA